MSHFLREEAPNPVLGGWADTLLAGHLNDEVWIPRVVGLGGVRRLRRPLGPGPDAGDAREGRDGPVTFDAVCYRRDGFGGRSMEFWGRRRELDRLTGELDRVIRSGQGRMLAIRGRRQSGKSRLLTQFVETAEVPYAFTTAVKNAQPRVQLEHVTADLRTARRPLTQLDAAFDAPLSSWRDLFARLPLAVGDGPAIVVLDEFPWATETDDTLEGVLQNAWDRTLERLPVLLVLVGSDLAMMERLTEHDRALYGRAEEMVVTPLGPAEVAAALGTNRSPVDLLDVYLATGGYPRLVAAAGEHRSARDFVHAQLADDQSPLAITGLRMLDAEFREDLHARRVLEAIGAVEVGHATFTSAVAQLGNNGAASTAVTRALEPLASVKKVIAIDLPVGAPAKSRLRRYRVADPYLRFWFRFAAPHLDDIARGRPDLAVGRFDRDFSAWRGKAIEPVVHEAVSRLAVIDQRPGEVAKVGPWWDRSGRHEFDIVAADRAGSVRLLGTIKWRPTRRLTAPELGEIAQARSVVPNASSARLLAVCPAGARAGVVPDVLLDAVDILDAFQ